jgi:hypothetical protein
MNATIMIILADQVSNRASNQFRLFPASDLQDQARALQHNYLQRCLELDNSHTFHETGLNVVSRKTHLEPILRLLNLQLCTTPAL